MKKTVKTMCSLALGLVALGAVGCATPAKMDFKSDKVLIDMSTRLGTTDQFSFTATRKLDSQLVENPAVSRRASIAVEVNRPDQAKAIVTGEGKTRTFYIGRKGSVIHDAGSGHYVRMPGQSTIDKSLDAAADKFDVEFPIQDFLANNPYHGFRMGSDTIVHAGNESVGGQDCDVLKGTREDLEWTLWVAKADKLPRRFIVNLTDLKGSDHLVIEFKEWNLTTKYTPGEFEFEPGEGDSEIEFLPAADVAAE